EVGLRHVAIGKGRDYDDVPPLRGAYAGSAGHQLDVSVSMRRSAAPVAPPPPPAAAPNRYPLVEVPPTRPDDGRLQHQPMDSRKQQQQQQQQEREPGPGTVARAAG